MNSTILDLLYSARDYADHNPLNKVALEHEMRRIFNTVNEVIGRLGGEVKPRKPYLSEPAADNPASASASALHP